MILSKKSLIEQAKHNGYRPEILEKVIRLADLLNKLVALPYLQERIALKGGTALNLFCFAQLPRLSVDIDLNYIGAVDRATLLKERPLVEEAISRICRQNGLVVERNPRAHAGGKMVLRYASVLGNQGNLEIDLNYMYRIPLFPIQYRQVTPGFIQTTAIPLLNLHELIAGKLSALFARQASRDLFDAHCVLTQCPLDVPKLRLAFTVYTAISGNPWQSITLDKINFAVDDLRNRLLPVLQQSVMPDTSYRAIAQWASQLTEECKAALAQTVLPFTEAEQEFLSKIARQEAIDAGLLCQDETTKARIQQHPALQWRLLNSRPTGA